jgi:Cu/Ag efflux protein CusF
MKHQPLLIAAALLAALSLPAFAQQKDTSETVTQSSPGKGTMTRTRTVVATVTEVDAPKRHVTLKGPQGNLFPLRVGPDVRNLEQVKVGDRVSVRYEEALSLTLKKDGKELRSARETTGGARAAAGERPGGVVADQVEVTADVVAVNPKRQTVTLRGPEQTVDLWVQDPNQLKLVKVGDQVQAVYTQALALSVEPAASAKK